MNTNFSDGDYVIVKKGNKITAMGFNISKVTNKKGVILCNLDFYFLAFFL